MNATKRYLHQRLLAINQRVWNILKTTGAIRDITTSAFLYEEMAFRDEYLLKGWKPANSHSRASFFSSNFSGFLFYRPNDPCQIIDLPERPPHAIGRATQHRVVRIAE